MTTIHTPGGARSLTDRAWTKKFKVAPERLLYSLQWLHSGTPPDFELQLVRNPQLWYDTVSLAILPSFPSMPRS